MFPLGVMCDFESIGIQYKYNITIQSKNDGKWFNDHLRGANNSV